MGVGGDFEFGFDQVEEDGGIAVETVGIDAFAGRTIRGQFAEGFAELASRSDRVVSGVVVAADGYVDQGLEEQAARIALGGPGFFEHFVALEELAVIEELDAAGEERVHAN